jgi:hypothetical protein
MRSRSVAVAAALVVAACGSPEPPPPAAAGGNEADWFVEAAGDAGIDFVHFNGMSGRHYYPEIMSPGVGLLDYDGDGDLDLYLVQGQMLGDTPVAQATYPPEGTLRDRLYRNDLTADAEGRPGPAFTDVTGDSGIDIRTYGMGVAAGDVDNDGFVDLYRTGLTESVLLHNEGDGTFTDVTTASGVANAGGWGVSAAFVDYDADGWLDLYVGNYLIYSLEGDIDCLAVTGRTDYCPPNSYRPQPDRLFRNRGDGTFVDVTQRALQGGAFGPALGVSTADFDGDGRIDIYVVGVYASSFNYAHIYVAMAAGVLGYAFVRLEYPIVAFLLGFIVGPLAEENFMRSYQITGGHLELIFLRPICAVLLVLSVLVIARPLWRNLLVSRRRNIGPQGRE